MTFGPSNTNGVFLPTTQYFPEEEKQFKETLTFVYSDIARRLNDKEIALYDLVELVSGQQWFTAGNPQIKRYAFRQVFTFTTTGTFAHNITGLTQVMAYGEFTDGTNFYGAIYASSVAIAGQVTFFVTPTNIVIQAGAGAPGITSIVIVLDYLKN